MSARYDGINAELIEDEAFRFIISQTRPVYTYPANGLPEVNMPPKKIETSFLTAARR